MSHAPSTRRLNGQLPQLMPMSQQSQNFLNYQGHPNLRLRQAEHFNIADDVSEKDIPSHEYENESPPLIGELLRAMFLDLEWPELPRPPEEQPQTGMIDSVEICPLPENVDMLGSSQIDKREGVSVSVHR